jgi:hypothetical protein
MKNLTLTVFLCIFLSTAVSAATITAIGNGSWIAASTWDAGRAPLDNDIVVIPATKTVSFSGSPYPKNTPTVRPTLNIKIYGTLDFSAVGNDKLYLDAGSTIQIFSGGKIQTSTSSSEIIAIHNGTDDNTVWTGTPATINGPASATATSSGFANGVLPLKFESFTIKKDNKGFATLTWVTSAEINALRFEIERSTSESPNWQVAGNVDASGNSSGTNEYNFVASLFAGENRFRLKQIDIDGKFTYSNVVSTRNISGDIIIIYDHSAHQLSFKGVSNDAKISIFDASGQTVYKGFANKGILSSPSSAGVYFVNVIHNNARLARKITVY